MGNLPQKINNPDQQANNPINELQILEGHEDIVRFMIKVDEERIASGSDDCTIIIWNRRTGEKEHVLKGHTLAITCLVLLERNIIVSGSADKTIRLWDARTGVCMKTLKAHDSSIKCLVSLGGNRFCSGSNDRRLCVWKNDGELLGTIERQEEENLHCLLPISGNRLISASNSTLLLVYKTDTFSYHRVLAYHRESVRCLVRISSNLFASASIDGGIVVWNAELLTPLTVLHNPEKYRNEHKVYIFNVKCLLPIGENYLAAAIGHGFRVYDVLSGNCVFDCFNQHDAEVNSLISLYDGSRIVSASSDACIKLWGTEQNFNFKSREAHTGGKMTPIQMGEMWAHSDAINQLLACTENSLASCSNDRTVILWKDGNVESEQRNVYALQAMDHQNAVDYEGVQEGTPAPAKRTNSGSLEHPVVPAEEDQLEASGGDRPASPNEMMTPSRTTRIPDYIFDYAEMLRTEKRLSIETISEHLRQQGHSDAIVLAVATKQLEKRNQ